MERAPPSSLETSRRMAKVKQKDTAAEITLRRELFRNGMRYRVNFVVLEKPRRVADIALPGLRIAVFVDGCFWHGCPQHATWPKQNAEFWRQKIEANRLRDADTNSRLLELGWTVLRFWEHESPVAAAAAVAQTVNAAKARRCESPVSAHKKK
ncbi:very short patch repair endonuclease [Acidovorax sp. LjRoot117]|uniref:very short patch repair endonuclease n=1 Tax=Acidovorax sp. LjRoot117 TaxID=3342255 RepID=UPI003ECE8BC4